MKVNGDGLYEGNVDGKRVQYPRVTSVIGEFFGEWDKVRPDILERACKFGQAVHTATEYDDQGILNHDDLAEPLKPYLNAWRDFMSQFKVDIEIIEPTLFSKRYQFAGRCDRIALVKGKRSIVEIKSRPYKALTDDLQTAAYQGSWNERNPSSKAIRRYVVDLRADGTYRVNQPKGASDYAIFLSAVALLNWKGRKK